MLLRPARLRSLAPCFQHRLHRNPVLAAALQHGIPVIAAWAFWLVLIRRIHDVHHCLMAHAFALHIDRAPGIKMRKAFVMVERLLVLCADFPQQAVHMVALVGQNRQVPAARAAECQPIPVQPHTPHRLCIRATAGHLIQIQIAAIGKI